MLDSVPTKLCHFCHVTNSALISSATQFFFYFYEKHDLKEPVIHPSLVTGVYCTNLVLLVRPGEKAPVSIWSTESPTSILKKKMILPSHPYYVSPFTHHPGVPHFAKRSLATPVFLRPTHAYIQRVFTQGEIIHLYNSCHLRGPLEYLRLWCSVV